MYLNRSRKTKGESPDFIEIMNDVRYELVVLEGHVNQGWIRILEHNKFIPLQTEPRVMNLFIDHSAMDILNKLNEGYAYLSAIQDHIPQILALNEYIYEQNKEAAKNYSQHPVPWYEHYEKIYNDTKKRGEKLLNDIEQYKKDIKNYMKDIKLEADIMSDFSLSEAEKMMKDIEEMTDPQKAYYAALNFKIQIDRYFLRVNLLNGMIDAFKLDYDIIELLYGKDFDPSGVIIGFINLGKPYEKKEIQIRADDLLQRMQHKKLEQDLKTYRSRIKVPNFIKWIDDFPHNVNTILRNKEKLEKLDEDLAEKKNEIKTQETLKSWIASSIQTTSDELIRLKQELENNYSEYLQEKYNRTEKELDSYFKDLDECYAKIDELNEAKQAIENEINATKAEIEKDENDYRLALKDIDDFNERNAEMLKYPQMYSWMYILLDKLEQFRSFKEEHKEYIRPFLDRIYGSYRPHDQTNEQNIDTVIQQEWEIFMQRYKTIKERLER